MADPDVPATTTLIVRLADVLYRTDQTWARYVVAIVPRSIVAFRIPFT